MGEVIKRTSGRTMRPVETGTKKAAARIVVMVFANSPRVGDLGREARASVGGVMMDGDFVYAGWDLRCEEVGVDWEVPGVGWV